MKEKALASQLIAAWHTNDPFELCQAMGFTVVRVPLSNEVNGFFLNTGHLNIIFLNDALESPRDKFVCAHELGHALLHAQDNRIFLDTATYQVTARLERAANRFACHLVYPEDSTFFEYPDYTTAQLAACLGLPEDLVRYRLLAHDQP